jgi:S1-C subfamily serine protease
MTDTAPLLRVRGLRKTYRSGDATLEVLRKGRTLEVPVVLAAYPEQTAAPEEPPRAETAATDLGLAVAPLTVERAKALKLEVGKGVLVTSVGAQSVGRALGVREGDVILQVNGVTVGTPEAYRKAIGKLTRGSKLTMSMRRGAMTMVKRLVL